MHLYLDIDGILNTNQTMASSYGAMNYRDFMTEYKELMDNVTEHIMLLSPELCQELVEHLKTHNIDDIVICSTWRKLFTLQQLKYLFYVKGYPYIADRIQGVTDPKLDRLEAIEKHIAENNVTEFQVMDDSLLNHPNLVLLPSLVGLYSFALKDISKHAPKGCYIRKDDHNNNPQQYWVTEYGRGKDGSPFCVCQVGVRKQRQQIPLTEIIRDFNRVEIERYDRRAYQRAYRAKKAEEQGRVFKSKPKSDPNTHWRDLISSTAIRYRLDNGMIPEDEMDEARELCNRIQRDLKRKQRNEKLIAAGIPPIDYDKENVRSGYKVESRKAAIALEKRDYDSLTIAMIRRALRENRIPEEDIESVKSLLRKKQFEYKKSRGLISEGREWMPRDKEPDEIPEAIKQKYGDMGYSALYKRIIDNRIPESELEGVRALMNLKRREKRNGRSPELKERDKARKNEYYRRKVEAAKTGQPMERKSYSRPSERTKELMEAKQYDQMSVDILKRLLRNNWAPEEDKALVENAYRLAVAKDRRKYQNIKSEYKPRPRVTGITVRTYEDTPATTLKKLLDLGKIPLGDIDRVTEIYKQKKRKYNREYQRTYKAKAKDTPVKEAPKVPEQPVDTPKPEKAKPEKLQLPSAEERARLIEEFYQKNPDKRPKPDEPFKYILSNRVID